MPARPPVCLKRMALPDKNLRCVVVAAKFCHIQDTIRIRDVYYVGTKFMIIAERSSLGGTRGRLDTGVIVVKRQIQTRAIQTQMRNNNAFFALHRSRSSGSYELLI